MSTEVVVINDMYTCSHIFHRIKTLSKPMVFVGVHAQEFSGIPQEIFRARFKPKHGLIMTVQILDPYHDGIYDYSKLIQFNCQWWDFKEYIENQPPWWDSLFYSKLREYVLKNKKSLRLIEPGRFTL